MTTPQPDHRSQFKSTLRHAHRAIRENVERNDFHIAAVMPSRGEDLEVPFAYTIGLEVTFGHPELFVVGLPPQLAHGVLHAAVARIREGKRYAEGVHDDVLQHGYTVYVRPVSHAHSSELFGQAIASYGSRDFSVLQLVLPDKQGRFPWQPECDPAYVHVQDGAAIGVNLSAPRAN